MNHIIYRSSPAKLFWLSLLVLLVGLAVVPTVGAQLGGEELPPGVTHDDVYAVADQMYCDVCEGIPLSSCTSVTCAAWRQEIANLLGQGQTADEIQQYFAERYGNEVTGVPISESQRNIAFGLPALLAVVLAVFVGWQLLRYQQSKNNNALDVARRAGLDSAYDRPVPDNVDPQGLSAFLTLVEESR